MFNTILDHAIFACEEAVGETEEIRAEYAKLAAIVKKIDEAFGREFSDDLEQCVYELRYGYAAAMFRWGWKLRSDPSLLDEIELH